jgi:hypothetical protein
MTQKEEELSIEENKYESAIINKKDVQGVHHREAPRQVVCRVQKRSDP